MNTPLWIGLGACLALALFVALMAVRSRRRAAEGGHRSAAGDSGGYLFAPVVDGGSAASHAAPSCDAGSSGGDCGGAH